jgi:hypothetical protein
VVPLLHSPFRTLHISCIEKYAFFHFAHACDTWCRWPGVWVFRDGKTTRCNEAIGLGWVGCTTWAECWDEDSTVEMIQCTEAALRLFATSCQSEQIPSSSSPYTTGVTGRSGQRVAKTSRMCLCAMSLAVKTQRRRPFCRTIVRCTSTGLFKGGYARDNVT